MNEATHSTLRALAGGFAGAALGGALGASNLVLPPLLGLEDPPDEQSPQTQARAVAWYVVGGLAAAGTVRLLARRSGTKD